MITQKLMITRLVSMSYQNHRVLKTINLDFRPRILYQMQL